MRKIFLAIVLASLFVISSNAQIKKGSLFLGGDIGGTFAKSKSNGVTTNKQNGVSITPVFGKAIKENLVLGFNVGLNIFNQDSEPDNFKYDIKAYDAGVFLRRYKNIATSGFYLFIQGGIGVSYYDQKQKGTVTVPDDTKRLTVGLNAYPGISYAVSKKFHLETGLNNILVLNYSNEKRKIGSPADTYKTNNFSVYTSLNNASSFRIGFRLLIGK